MPFTLAHPAAVLPFIRKSSSMVYVTGWVLGSMSPDFEYFIHLKPYATYGHDIVGFFIINMPLCFLVAYVFHTIIKEPLIRHLPQPLDKWFHGISSKKRRLHSINEIAIFVFSALGGMITHVIWDSFTHISGKMVELLPFLSLQVSHYGIPLYKVLQHTSSMIGMIIIIAYLYINRNENAIISPMSGRQKIFFFGSIGLISMIVIAIIVYIQYRQLKFISIGTFIVSSMSSIFLGLLIVSIYQKRQA